ncbi:MAG: hypothetical protein HYI21_10790 [Sediminibacterium sp. Gen4]|jgi:hypothetical protein|uniref:PBECR3 domain-containing polyvalent protein n=1 Tax=Sediminibacterium sp. Gen4 TaxID=2736285 RepID=UPI0015BEC78C|nr:hypothetical protein [Sediminibacterium sp. Gen4]MBW0162195.1 hypothetical protein [Sediminibacterium sp.]NWK66505.1 hypothetical protein [Sediminibacterium sp. Gen4]
MSIENPTVQELLTIAKQENEELKKQYVLDFGQFPNSTARDISQDTGVNVIGARLILNPFGIAHVLKYHSHKKEKERGQIPVVDQDFDLVTTIVREHDSYQIASPNQRGEPGIYFYKTINKVLYTVCMTYTDKKDRYTKERTDKKLTLSTMYKKNSQ